MDPEKGSHSTTMNPLREGQHVARRGFLGATSTLAMGIGLASGYGGFAAMAGRFLYPARLEGDRIWLYVARIDDLQPNAALDWVAPSGAPITLTRRGEGRSAEDLLALSSTCPHLGCQVSWEPQNNRFFCPCHNGVFNPDGLGTEGPPKGQQLLRYPIKVEEGLIYIEVSTAVFG